MFKLGRFMRLVEDESGYRVAFYDENGHYALHDNKYSHYLTLNNEAVLLYDICGWCIFDISGDFVTENANAIIRDIDTSQTLHDITSKVLIDGTGIKVYYACGREITVSYDGALIGSCILVDRSKNKLTILETKSIRACLGSKVGIKACSSKDLLKLRQNIEITESEDGYYCTLNGQKIEGNYECVMYNYCDSVIILYNKERNKKFLLIDLESELQSYSCNEDVYADKCTGDEFYVIVGNTCIETGRELILPGSIVICEDWYIKGEEARGYLNKTYSHNEELLYDCFYTMARPL